MPPANTPNVTSPSDPRSPRSATDPVESSVQRPLTPLSYLSSPVPDLAATLHTQAADEADEANVSFLRNSLESLDQAAESHGAAPTTRHSSSRPERSQDPRTDTQRRLDAHVDAATAAVLSDTGDDLSRRERLQRVLARLNRLHDPAGSSASAYGNRSPSPNRQRLYDWAPSQDEPAQQDDNELDQILAELRRSQPETHPDILRVSSLVQRQQDASRQRDQDTQSTATPEQSDATDRRDRLRERRMRENEWVSLRSRAVLQRARQESSPSATERMLRYVMERERSGMSEEEERARGGGWLSPGAGGTSGRASSSEQHRSGGGPSRDSWPLPPAAGELRARTLQERAEVMQRRYLAENAPPRLPRISTPPVPAASSSTNNPSQFLENALKYLNQLRSCCRYEEALSAAIDHGLATKEFFADKHDDFVMDLEELEPLPASSLLQPGSVFEGHQHATSGNAGLLQTRPSSSSPHAIEQINPHYRTQGVTSTGFDHPPGSTQVRPFDASRPWLSHQFTPPSLHLPGALSNKPPEPCHDHWPVRVMIHSIDPEKMTLQGTMEAYDVPQHPASISLPNSAERPKAGKKHAAITTFLEGHIIDLTTHSFLTPSAKDAQRFGPHPTAAQNATPYTTLSDTISFPSANAHTDAANWRRLPPFNTLRDSDEMARLLLSKGRMDEIHQQYIFMRWKERCFVHTKEDKCSESERRGDQDRGHGLTISGFYYVSLKRSDGSVEGLYFDPTSTPYQCLRLVGTGPRRGWGSVELR